MRFFSILMLSLFLFACGSSPSPILPPQDLTQLTNKIEIKRLWNFTVGEGIGEFYLKLKPAINGNTGYVVDHTGYIRAFDIHTGKLIWENHLKTHVSGGLRFHDGKILLGNSKGEVIVIDANNAKELWRTQLSSEILSAPIVAKGILVAKTIDGRVYGLDADSGVQRWVYDRSVPRLTLRGNSAPLISNDVVIIASDNGKLSALTLSQGKLLWETTISVPKGRNELERIIDLDVDPVISDDIIYTVGYQGRLAAVKISSGQLVWSRDFSSYSGLYVDAYRLYITDSMGQVWALNRYNGSTLWRQDKLLRRQLTAPEAQGDYIVVGDYDGYLHWLGREDGELIARKRMNTFGIEDDSELDNETKLYLSKQNNILVKPLVTNKLLLTMDRIGHVEAYQIIKN